MRGRNGVILKSGDEELREIAPGRSAPRFGDGADRESKLKERLLVLDDCLRHNVIPAVARSHSTDSRSYRPPWFPGSSGWDSQEAFRPGAPHRRNFITLSYAATFALAFVLP